MGRVLCSLRGEKLGLLHAGDSDGKLMQEFISEVIEGDGEGALGIKLYKNDVLRDVAEPFISEQGQGKQRLYMTKAEASKLSGLMNEHATDVNAISGAIDIVDKAESVTCTLCRDRF